MGKRTHKKRKLPFVILFDIVEEIFEFILGAIVVVIVLFVLWFSDASFGNLIDRIQSSITAVESTINSSTQDEPASTSVKMEEVVVTKVIDGDTIECSNGETIRLIGIDTPESTSEKERYGREASEYTEDKIEGETVWLTKDKSETDQYGRSLRFVWTEPPTSFTEDEFREKCFNAELVLNGYATESTYAPDDTYSEYFKQFEEEARAAGVGMWEKQ